MEKLYSNIKQYREKLRLSQDELAKLTGYTSRSPIAKIEKGKVDLPQSKIKIFATALIVTENELKGYGEQSPEEMAEEDFYLLERLSPIVESR